MTAPAVARRWAGPGAATFAGGVAREQMVRLRRLAPWGAVVLTALVAHVAVMPHVAPGGVAPDGLLVAAVAVAAGRGARAGAAFGFASGLGADLFLSTPLGTSALAYTILGHALGRSNRPSPPARPVALRRSAVLTFGGVCAGQMAAQVVATALGGVPFPDLQTALGMAGVGAVSVPFGPPAFAAVGRLAPSSRNRP